jgi:hypothetical protein
LYPMVLILLKKERTDGKGEDIELNQSSMQVRVTVADVAITKVGSSYVRRGGVDRESWVWWTWAEHCNIRREHFS